MSGNVTAKMTERKERHHVELRLTVTGAPVIDDRDALVTKHPIRPEIVSLDYSRNGKKWYARARVYGAQTSGGSLMRGWADFLNRADSVEHWPTWLVDLAEQHHPARPGGWPGDAPEGSYL